MTTRDGPPSGTRSWRTRRPGDPRVLSRLVRADFERPLTAALVPPLYRGLCALIGLAGAVGVVAAFATTTWLGLVALAAAPMLVLGAVAVLRVVAEFAMGVVQMATDVSEIAATLPRLETTISDVADDVPRLGWLKLLSGPRER